MLNMDYMSRFLQPIVRGFIDESDTSILWVMEVQEGTSTSIDVLPTQGSICGTITWFIFKHDSLIDYRRKSGGQRWFLVLLALILGELVRVRKWNNIPENLSLSPPPRTHSF
ncbi:hypothetical protein VTN31DRAFT_601 [Thermomyces dupontii]|uniref:uncharacterized protein n=1 Tax=Talaromyces thermophilus TaxID=28565 RepID=UPI0037431E42